jgi:hypothetical protein
MNNPITKELLAMLEAYAEKALSEDDPTSTCAAYHRGEIGAYKGLIGRIKWEERELKRKNEEAAHGSN